MSMGCFSFLIEIIYKNKTHLVHIFQIHGFFENVSFGKEM